MTPSLVNSLNGYCSELFTPYKIETGRWRLRVRDSTRVCVREGTESSGEEILYKSVVLVT